MRTGGRNSHIQGEPFPPQGSQGTSAAEVSTGLVLPTCEQRGCVRPSLPSPAGSSGAAGCEQEERSLWSPGSGGCSSLCPFSCLSVQLVLTAPVPSPALAVLPAIPPCPLASLGVGRPAPFLPPSRVYAWQLQPTRVR